MSIHVQSEFAEALLDRTKATPPGLLGWSGARPVKRFGVYRNNVSAGLVQALAVRFPATEAIVGKEFFAAMASAYAMQNLPQSPVLLHYGSDFATFVESFAPAAELPYLADVVRLENARTEAYHAADVAPVPREALASIEPSRLTTLKFVFHPSFAIVRSRFPIVTIWAMNSGEAALQPIDQWVGEDALVQRPGLSVLTHRLPPGGAPFLAALGSGQSLEAAAEAASEEVADFDLAANFTAVLSSGLVIAVSNEFAEED